MSDIKEKVIKRTMTSASEYNYTSTSKEITELRELFLDVKEKQEALFNSEKELYNSRMIILENMLSATTAMYFLDKIDETMNTSGNDSLAASILKNNRDIILILSEVKDELTRILTKQSVSDTRLKELTNSIRTIFNILKLSVGLSEETDFNILINDDGDITQGYTIGDDFIQEATTVRKYKNEDIEFDLVGNINTKTFTSGTVTFSNSYRHEDGSSNYPFIITSIKDLEKIVNTTYEFNISNHYRLEKDLDLTKEEFEPITLIGVFDGNGCTIKSKVFPFKEIGGEIKNTVFSISESQEADCKVLNTMESIDSSLTFTNCSFSGSGVKAKVKFSTDDSNIKLNFKSSYFSNIIVEISDKLIIINNTGKQFENSISSSAEIDEKIKTVLAKTEKRITVDMFTPFKINSGTKIVLDFPNIDNTLDFINDKELDLIFKYSISESENIDLTFRLKFDSGGNLEDLPALEKVVYHLGRLTTLDAINTIIPEGDISEKVECIDYEGDINIILISLADAYSNIESRIKSKFELMQKYVMSYVSLEFKRESEDSYYSKDFVNQIISDIYNIYLVILDTEKTDENKYSDILLLKESCFSNINILINDCFKSIKTLETFIREYNPFLHSDHINPASSINIIFDYNVVAENDDTILPFADIMLYRDWYADAIQVFADSGYIISILYTIHEIGVNLCSNPETLSILRDISNFIVNLQIDSACIDEEMFKEIFIEQISRRRNFRSRNSININSDFIFEEINPSITAVAPELEIVNRINFSPYITDTVEADNEIKKIENVIIMAFYKSISQNGKLDTDIIEKLISIYSNGYLGLKDYICRDLLYKVLEILKPGAYSFISFFKLDEKVLTEYQTLYTFFVNNENGFLLSYLEDDPLNIRENFLHIKPNGASADVNFETIVDNTNDLMKRLDFVNLRKVS